MVLAEAMFSRLPIVASDIGGVSDAVVDGKTGYIVKPGDVAQLQSRAFKLLSDVSLRNQFGDNAYKKASSEFSLDAMLDKYESVFRKVLR